MHMLPRLEDQSARKINFIMTWQVSGICKSLVKWLLVWGTLPDMLGDRWMVLRECMKGMELAKKVEVKRLLEFCDEKEFSVENTWFEKKERRKIKNIMGVNEIKINFVLVGKNNRKHSKDVKAIP